MFALHKEINNSFIHSSLRTWTSRKAVLPQTGSVDVDPVGESRGAPVLIVVIVKGGAGGVGGVVGGMIGPGEKAGVSRRAAG
jgi:hypothetical protein